GKSRAIQIMAEGENLGVDIAADLGLVNRIFEGETLDTFMRAVMDYAHEFCPPNKASIAVGRMKRAVQAGADMSLEQGLSLERELQQELFATADAKEGLSAF